MPKILLIDDDPEILKLCAAALEEDGYTMLTAENGEVGCKMALSESPDLIICDIQMERMDGFETLCQLRESSATSAIPFIFITGADDDSNMRRGMDLGADDYLHKPFRIQQLKAAIEARLRKHEAIRRRAETTLEELRSHISLMLPHELNTPLNGIIGYADMVVMDIEDLSSEEIVDAGRSIRQSARRLQALIERFLMFAHIELLHANPEEAATLRNERISEVGGLIMRRAREAARSRNRVGDLELSLEEATLAISEDLFAKIVDEVVDNACKFSKPGTPVRVQATAKEKSLVVSVVDEGLGMLQQQIDSIGAYRQFERKLQEQQGSGLGLIIAKRLTELHGGSLFIESVHGEGTAVKITFPRID